jgi:hypothetical protein
MLKPAILGRADGPGGLTVPGMVAEMELGFIRRRQRDGIDAAKAKGVYKGRPPLSTAPALSRCARKGWEPRKSLGRSDASGATSIRRSRPRGSIRRQGVTQSGIDDFVAWVLKAAKGNLAVKRITPHRSPMVRPAPGGPRDIAKNGSKLRARHVGLAQKWFCGSGAYPRAIRVASHFCDTVVLRHVTY